MHLVGTVLYVLMYCTGIVPYLRYRYRYSTVPVRYGTVGVGKLVVRVHVYVYANQIAARHRQVANLICSSGFFACANHLFYRFWTVFRVRGGIVTWYESCVRLISPFDFLLRACVRACVRSAAAWVVIAIYSYLFWQESVIIRPFSFKIQIRDPYDELL